MYFLKVAGRTFLPVRLKKKKSKKQEARNASERERRWASAASESHGRVGKDERASAAVLADLVTSDSFPEPRGLRSERADGGRGSDEAACDFSRCRAASSRRKSGQPH